METEGAKSIQDPKGEKEAEKPKKSGKVLANSHPSRTYARGSLSRSIKVFHQPYFPCRAV